MGLAWAKARWCSGSRGQFGAREGTWAESGTGEGWVQEAPVDILGNLPWPYYGPLQADVVSNDSRGSLPTRPRGRG